MIMNKVLNGEEEFTGIYWKESTIKHDLVKDPFNIIYASAIETRIDYETVDMKLEERTKSILLKHARELKW